MPAISVINCLVEVVWIERVFGACVVKVNVVVVRKFEGSKRGGIYMCIRRRRVEGGEGFVALSKDYARLRILCKEDGVGLVDLYGA